MDRNTKKHLILDQILCPGERRMKYVLPRGTPRFASHTYQIFTLL